MGLGWSAVTLACHMLIVYGVLKLIGRAAYVRRFENIAQRLWASEYVHWSFWAVATSWVIERVYYVFARYAQIHEVDLWSTHPVPETLSLSIALALLNMSHAMRRVAGMDGDWVSAKVTTEFILLAAAATWVVVVFW